MRTVTTGGGENASLPLMLTELFDAWPSRLVLLTTSRSGVAGGVTEVLPSGSTGDASGSALALADSTPGCCSGGACT